MYSQVFGSGIPDFGEDFTENHFEAVNEYEEDLMEAPLEKPYEFCGRIRESNGE